MDASIDNQNKIVDTVRVKANQEVKDMNAVQAQVVKTETELSVDAMIAIGGSRWTKYGKDRVYFDSDLIAKILGLSNSKSRRIAGDKFWYDVTAGEFKHWGNNCNGVTAGEWSAAIRRESTVDVTAATTDQQKPFPDAMLTSTGEWVSPDEWDDIEAAM